MKDDTAKFPKRGPEPERLRLEGDWTEATKKALEKKRPEEGWPDRGVDQSTSNGGG